jgi:glutathione S-transferase
VDATWAALLGLVFVVARVLYLVGYVKDPAKREVGFGLSSLSVVVLLLGALWGVARQVL